MVFEKGRMVDEWGSERGRGGRKLRGILRLRDAIFLRALLDRAFF